MIELYDREVMALVTVVAIIILLLLGLLIGFTVSTVHAKRCAKQGHDFVKTITHKCRFCGKEAE